MRTKEVEYSERLFGRSVEIYSNRPYSETENP